MIISTLLPVILPLYALIALGYIGARHLEVNLHSLAMVAIYFVSPVVIFGGIVNIDFQMSYLILPAVLFVISAVIGVSSYWGARWAFKGDKKANLIGMTGTNGNSGYFGLPIVLTLFGPSAVGIYLMMSTAIELSTNTAGYYILARGNFSIKDSFFKVMKLPPLHGMVLGLIWNFTGWPLPEVFFTYWEYFTGTWVVIGMMIIGVALGKTERFHFDPKLFSWMMVTRYVAWPAFTLGFIALDRMVLGMFDGRIHTLLLLFGIVPHAANAVPFAAQLKVHPEDAATVVLISTCFALFFVPFCFWVFGAPFS